MLPFVQVIMEMHWLYLSCFNFWMVDFRVTSTGITAAMQNQNQLG